MSLSETALGDFGEFESLGVSVGKFGLTSRSAAACVEMGQGQSGDHLAVAVLSHVVQSGRAELMAMRRHMADSSKR